MVEGSVLCAFVYLQSTENDNQVDEAIRATSESSECELLAISEQYKMLEDEILGIAKKKSSYLGSLTIHSLYKAGSTQPKTIVQQ